MPNTFVAPPIRKRRVHGIKSVTGGFIQNDRLGVGAEIEWVSEGCSFPSLAPGLCYATAPVDGDKTFNGIAVGAGPVFGLYSGVQCWLGADTDYDLRARRQLAAGEERGVEAELWSWASSTAGAGVAAVSVTSAIASLDEVADSDYLGVPVLLMSRAVAVRATAERALSADRESGVLYSPNGTPVIASGAFPEDAIIIIGWPTVYASPFTVITALDPVLNTEMAIAERVYALAVDCGFASKATIPV